VAFPRVRCIRAAVRKQAGASYRGEAVWSITARRDNIIELIVAFQEDACAQ
jgi:hypothetical protein